MPIEGYVGVLDEEKPTAAQADTIQAIKEFAIHTGTKFCLEHELIDLPGMIATEALELLKLTCDIEKERKIIADLKDDASNIILGLMENGKPKYSNDKARDAAVKMWLRENKEYCTSVDELARAEYHQRKKQIDIAFFENKFQACRSIALIRGVK